MVTASLSLYPVLTQPEYINSYAVLSQDVKNASVLSVTFRKDELIPLLEKVEQWGADFPLVVPDAWVVWKELTTDMQMPEEYVWVWIDPTLDEKKVSLKVFVVSHGQPRFVFQPFVANDREEILAGSIAGVLRLAMDCATREQKGVAEETPFYFSSYRLKLGSLVPRLALGRHPIGQLAPEHPPQECAANLCQRSPSGFKNWLPAFWKTYQTQRSQARRRFKMIKLAAAVYVVLLAGLICLGFWQKHAISSEASLMESRRPDYEKALSLKKQVARMRTQAEGNQTALDVLYLTTMALPKEVTLTGYGFKLQDALSLRGFASSNTAVYDFVEALKKQKPFRSVELNSVRNNPLKNWVEFDIQCKLGSPSESTETPEKMAALDVDRKN